MGRARLLLFVLGHRRVLFISACPPTHFYRWRARCHSFLSFHAIRSHRQPQFSTRPIDGDAHHYFLVGSLRMVPYLTPLPEGEGVRRTG